MSGWNLADILEVVAREVPEAPAIIQGVRVVSFASLDSRAASVAAFLTGRGIGRQAKVAQYLRNGPEYLESIVACFKGSFVPLNTNYRYGASELTYLWNNADTAVVLFHGSYADTIESMREQVPSVRLWLMVDDGSGLCPGWAMPYEPAPNGELPAETAAPHARSGDDLVLLYTGGTTGLPKGVMWRQDDLFVKLGNASNGRYPDVPDLDYARKRVASHGRRHLPAAPLMHGAGCLTCLPVIARGGAAVLLAEPAFRAGELLDTIERHRVNSVGWVGDAFARPVLAELDA